MQTLGAPHRDHHHHVAQHPGKQDQRLEHGADYPVQGVVILGIRTSEGSGERENYPNRHRYDWQWGNVSLNYSLYQSSCASHISLGIVTPQHLNQMSFDPRELSWK